MLSFSDYSLQENYKNFIGPSSEQDRLLWIDQVWDILQSSYKAIGGIKGNGFTNKESLVTNIPFWKLYTKNDKVVAAAFYKDKSGRKAVAIATDGSELGSKIVSDMYQAGLGVSYGEKSGKALGKMMKVVPWDVLQGFMLKPADVSKLTGDATVVVDKFGYDNLDDKDKFSYDKYPKLRPYMYVRELGGSMHLKVSIGTPNLPIIKTS